MATTMDNFIGLSEVLTGFSRTIFAPDLDPTDIKSVYLPLFQSKIAAENPSQPQLVDQILNQFEALQSQKLTPQQIGEALLDEQKNGADFVLACRKLIFLWYAGAWPTLLPATPSQAASTVSQMVSGTSYSMGLVWQVMQSHPMGDSRGHYGEWESPPTASLDDFTGNTTNPTGAAV